MALQKVQGLERTSQQQLLALRRPEPEADLMMPHKCRHCKLVIIYVRMLKVWIDTTQEDYTCRRGGPAKLHEPG